QPATAKNRRSLYLFARRNYNLTMLGVFDQPVMATNCTRRISSAVPLQSLTLLNDAFMLEQADRFARRVAALAGPAREKRIGLAFAYLLHQEAAGESFAQDLKPRPPHFAPRARAMVHFMQNGGPSQMDLFDPKPELQKRGGQQIPKSVEIYQMGNSDKILSGPFAFKKWGKSGLELAEVLPHTGGIADDLCLVRSMYTEHNNHTEALVMMS